VGSEMSKGERMRTHTERTESDHLSAQISPAKGETENSTHCVLNLEKTWFARFITQRVMNFSPRLKTPQKTRELEFGTHCVPNFGFHFNILADRLKYRKEKAWNRVI
jgi:hypothetical protein